MFETKRKSLFKRKNTVKKNTFLNSVEEKSAKTLSGNGAIKYSTTGSEWVDQFTKLGGYKSPRLFGEIANDCSVLWAEDKELFVKFALYIRMISRKTNLPFLGITTEKPQSGAELRHEGIMRMIWLQTKDPETFWKNVGLFISAGSCKDIITMLRYDLVHHGWEGRVLNWERYKNLILSLLENKSTVNLIKKYLPQIRSNSTCSTVDSQANNIIAKWICSFVTGGNYEMYRKLKTSGTAHEWQKLISKNKYDKLDFSKIHGRALNLLVRSKFLRNHNLQKVYSEWIEKQKTVKYTGYVHEILCELDGNRDRNFELTVDKQFAELVQKVKQSDENITKFIVVRDVSLSMTRPAEGTNYSSYNVAKALALYFSEFLTGEFANHYMTFSNTVKLKKWKGSTPSEKWRNAHGHAYGGTNFQSVIDLLCSEKKKGIAEEDFPQGILCISDGEFNPASLSETNVKVALTKLARAGFSQSYVDNFKIVLWNLQNNFYGYGKRGAKFETYGDAKNVFYMSGYSASNVKFILNDKVETAQDLFDGAMNQELLNFVQV